MTKKKSRKVGRPRGKKVQSTKRATRIEIKEDDIWGAAEALMRFAIIAEKETINVNSIPDETKFAIATIKKYRSSFFTSATAVRKYNQRIASLIVRKYEQILDRYTLGTVENVAHVDRLIGLAEGMFNHAVPSAFKKLLKAERGALDPKENLIVGNDDLAKHRGTYFFSDEIVKTCRNTLYNIQNSLFSGPKDWGDSPSMILKGFLEHILKVESSDALEVAQLLHGKGYLNERSSRHPFVETLNAVVDGKGSAPELPGPVENPGE